jgi:hypothetical protein
MNKIRRGCALFAGCSMTALVLTLSLPARGQESSAINTPEHRISLTPGIMDRAQAEDVRDLRSHALAAHTPAATALRAAELANRVQENAQEAESQSVVRNLATPSFYPEDLVYSKGALVKNAQFHDIYVNCTTVSTCWGNPSGFLSDLGKSSFIHVTDQYVGTTANNRYIVGTGGFVTVPSGTLFTSDILVIVHAVAANLKNSGYGHIFHVFLPKGTDTCFDNGTQCYSPDNPSTFFFCGYHSSATFSDIGHVLFTVEPYQNVPGCKVAAPNPNGPVTDSTNSVLSHESFETITDPDPASGWTNLTSLAVEGSEIGDECQPLANSAGAALDPTFAINGKSYEVQLEYSNFYHACVSFP